MDEGRFYFVKDEFFKKHDPHRTLMQNKESIDGKLANRPCFMAFPDDKHNNIFWLVPFSSKTDKYKGIVAQKAKKRAERNLPPRECDTIRFGDVLGIEKAFLIQNMFPITESYISNQYLDKNIKAEVRISRNIEQEIISCAKKVLKLHRNGVNLIFGDIDAIYRQLTAELLQQTVT